MNLITNDAIVHSAAFINGHHGATLCGLTIRMEGMVKRRRNERRGVRSNRAATCLICIANEGSTVVDDEGTEVAPW